MSRRRTFFERITGTVNMDNRDRFRPHDPDDVEDEIYDEEDDDQLSSRFNNQYNPHRIDNTSVESLNKVGLTNNSSTFNNEWLPKSQHGGELSIDLYDLDEEIVLQAMIAGVRPEDLDINVTREMVTIEGHREGAQGVPDQNYTYQELFWGAFNRTVTLPAEIEVEEAEASESHGLLTIRMPKLDKARSTKLKVRSRS